MITASLHRMKIHWSTGLPHFEIQIERRDSSEFCHVFGERELRRLRAESTKQAILFPKSYSNVSLFGIEKLSA